MADQYQRLPMDFGRSRRPGQPIARLDREGLS